MEINLENFKVGEYYTVYTEETGSLTGRLIGKNKSEGINEKLDIIILYVPNVDTTKYIDVTKVENYFWYDLENIERGVKVYDSYLEEYGIDSGEFMSSVLIKLISRWEEIEDEEKRNLAGHLLDGINVYTLTDTLNTISKQNQYFAETHDKIADLLKMQESVCDKTKEVLYGYGEL